MHFSRAGVELYYDPNSLPGPLWWPGLSFMLQLLRSSYLQPVYFIVWSVQETLNHLYLKIRGSPQVRGLKRTPSINGVAACEVARTEQLKAVIQIGKVRTCVCLCERKIIRTPSPCSFSSFCSQATEIILFYANLLRALPFICILSFVFYLSASWNSLLQVIGFLIFLLCLSSWANLHSDEVTYAKCGTKKLSWKF